MTGIYSTMRTVDLRWPKKNDLLLRDWLKPPRTLNLTVVDGRWVTISFSESDPLHLKVSEAWSISRSEIEGACRELLQTADDFWLEYSEEYFNILNPDDIDKHLNNSYVLLENWEGVTAKVDDKYQKSWEQVSTSPELRKLANRGYDLFQLFFPEGTKRKQILNSLPVASRINISWPQQNDNSWLPHVPWGLMFQNEPPDSDEPVDPLNFLGLRYRVEYISYNESKSTGRHLGAFHSTNKIYCLYWGGKQEIQKEVLWQKEKLHQWPEQQTIIAPHLNSTQPKSEVVALFKNPQPTPANLLYFFCNCKINAHKGSPTLQFGDTYNSKDTLDQDDIGRKQFLDEPIVFANACSTTTSSDPYIANKLEAKFFNRGCRAYIGTETKVPVIFASRFASIYFDIFYRSYGSAQSRPISSGEAFMQTRMFLWRYFKNIGGLLYSYVGIYDLFMSEDSESNTNQDGVD